MVNYFARGEECQICLVRAHHLLLRQEHLTLADFLPLKYSTDNWTCQESDSPFTNLYAQPFALPRLRQMLIESFSNYWNDFLYNNDPTERPEILKKRTGVFQCVKIATIVLICTLKEVARYLIVICDQICKPYYRASHYLFLLFQLDHTIPTIVHSKCNNVTLN